MDNIKNNIIKFFEGHKRMPSYTELMKLTGYKSKSTIFRIINNLVENNLLEKDSKGKIIPKNIFHNLKVLGHVEAGFPTPAEEDLLDSISLDDFLINNKQSSYILKVKGDSMADAGIYEGDLVIVERVNSAKNGQIVIAEVDGKWTMKFYRKKSTKVYLEPGNKKYPVIYPENELNINAIVKAVIRKF